MNRILYSLNEAVLGIAIPGRIFYNEKTSQEAEARNCSLKNIPNPMNLDENDFVIGAIDAGTYIGQAGCIAYSLQTGDMRAVVMAGTIAALRGASSIYQRLQLERVVSENKEFDSIRFLESVH